MKEQNNQNTYEDMLVSLIAEDVTGLSDLDKLVKEETINVLIEKLGALKEPAIQALKTLVKGGGPEGANAARRLAGLVAAGRVPKSAIADLPKAVRSIVTRAQSGAKAGKTGTALATRSAGTVGTRSAGTVAGTGGKVAADTGKAATGAGRGTSSTLRPAGPPGGRTPAGRGPASGPGKPSSTLRPAGPPGGRTPAGRGPASGPGKQLPVPAGAVQKASKSVGQRLAVPAGLTGAGIAAVSTGAALSGGPGEEPLSGQTSGGGPQQTQGQPGVDFNPFAQEKPKRKLARGKTVMDMNANELRRTVNRYLKNGQISKENWRKVRRMLYKDVNKAAKILANSPDPSGKTQKKMKRDAAKLGLSGDIKDIGKNIRTDGSLDKKAMARSRQNAIELAQASDRPNRAKAIQRLQRRLARAKKELKIQADAEREFGGGTVSPAATRARLRVDRLEGRLNDLVIDTLQDAK